MARVVNEKNEVIAKKDENKKIEKKPISKTSLIVGVVLFLIALAVAIVLIVYFTKKDDSVEEKDPTLLEQYIDNYKNEYKKDLQIYFDKSFSDRITNYEGECYVLLYDSTWKQDNAVGSEKYNLYLNIDEWFTGTGTTTAGNKKTSVFDAYLEAGTDTCFFVFDYSTVEVEDKTKEQPKLKLNNGKEMYMTAPVLLHVELDDYTTIIGEKDTKDVWTRELTNLISTFKRVDK